MQRQFLLFLLRWVFNSLGLWIAARILSGNGITYDENAGVGLFLGAGFILSVVNAILKPLIIILSLPAILLTLGLFTLIVNGFMVYLAGKIVPGSLEISFWAAVLAGMIISLINYVLTSLVDTSRNRTDG
ncbi:MAG TPA: phage holin family protein [Candidatus Saccharimonadales bacterium]|jgi:putative membrane protein|nr:phage holin family protein [Candidatus Saccharimonadales bacterium]